MSVLDHTASGAAARDNVQTFTVRLVPEFVTKLLAVIRRIDLSEGESEQGLTGLLFGRRETGLVLVGGFRPCAFYDLRNGELLPDGRLDTALQRAVSAAAADPDLKSFSELIGWCCIRSGRNAGLSEPEIEFHKQRFQQPCYFALLINVTSGSGVVFGAYARSGEGLISAPPVPVDLGAPVKEAVDITIGDTASGAQSVLRTAPEPETIAHSDAHASSGNRVEHEERSTTVPPEAEADQTRLPQRVLPGSSPEPAGTADERVRRNIGAWPKFAAVVLIFAIGIWIGMYTRSRRSALPISRSLPVNTSARPALNLRVQPTIDGLVVTWNHTSPALEAVNYGVLFVDDGSTHRDVVLAANQIKSGSILYRPTSDQVSLRLEIFGKKGSLATDSILVLGTSSSEPQATAGGAPPVPAAEPSRPEHESILQGEGSPTRSTPTYVPPQPVKEILPNTKAAGFPTIKKSTDIEVRITIDERGYVTSARAAGQISTSDELLADEAVKAAKKWLFAPAKLNGQPTTCDHSIVFQFHPSHG